MQYVLLIYTEEPAEQPSTDVIMAEIESYNAFTEHVRARGALKAGEALHPSTAATTVRVRDGHTVATDGPFAETKEALGGFYLVEAADLDEAIAYAAMIPGAKHGSVEVRPIIDFTAPQTRAVPEAVGAD
ncbi:MAG TPA: YciI family protein [Methylomirabilota bacterium]|nr:YciI family protein [Methylomirabilota bacterium]